MRTAAGFGSAYVCGRRGERSCACRRSGDRVAARTSSGHGTLINETVQLAILDGSRTSTSQRSSRPTICVYSQRWADGYQRTPLVSARCFLPDCHPSSSSGGSQRSTCSRSLRQRSSIRTSLRVRLAEVRTRGYGLDEGEYTVGVFCVAVPVLGAGGDTVAAISSSVPTVRAVGGTQDRMVEVLTDTAARISADLGFRAGSNIVQ